MTFQTIGSVDGQHKLPAPKQYVAISVLWGILFLLADTGFGKLAARLSMLVLLTATVLGPFGAKVVGFLNTISDKFAVPPAAPGTPGAGPGAAPYAPTAPSISPMKTA